MTQPLYKILLPDGSPCHGGSGKWSLPNGKPGKWMPEIEDIEPCERGYHLCRPADLPMWMRHGTHLFRVETRGELLAADDKVVAASARLLSRVETWTNDVQRAWGEECALRAVRATLPRALRAAGLAEPLIVACETADGLRAAESAAWAAAEAAESAAWAAQSAARAAWAAEAAAEAAEAAESAAWAAWAAERRWQSDRLVELLGLEEA